MAAFCDVTRLVLGLLSLAIVVTPFSYELSMYVGPGEVECLYQHIHLNKAILEIDYQVIDGASLDISFQVKTPDGQTIRADMRKKSASHQIHVQQVGDYEMCFDNKFSTMTPKLVFFELYTDFDDQSFVNSEQQARLDASKSQVSDEARDLMDVTTSRIKGVLDQVQTHVHKSRNIQGVIRGYMKQDRSMAEANYSRVNMFSALYIFVMLSVSLVQVLMIRSLFETKDTHKMSAST